MSASISPTRCPIFDSAMARFTATVVLPTPPLPEPIATIFETPGNATGEGMAEECAISFIAPFLETLVDSNRSKLPRFESIKILASGNDHNFHSTNRSENLASECRVRASARTLTWQNHAGALAPEGSLSVVASVHS